MDKNKKLCMLTLYPWHEISFDGVCQCGKYLYTSSERDEHLKENKNPDFTSRAGRSMLIEIMEKHPLGKLFFAKLMYVEGDGYCPIVAQDDDGYIVREYFMGDVDDRLLTKAIEFLEKNNH